MELIDHLKKMEFTEAEARLYICLLGLGKATGYELSKQSGIARSKIYNHLESLSQRGILESSQSGKTTYYRAISPDELVRLTERSLKNTLDSFQYLASKLPSPEDDPGVWKIEDYDRVMVKALDMVESSEDSLYIQLWTQEISPELREAINRKNKELRQTLTIVYDQEQNYQTGLDQFYAHGFEMERLKDMTQRWITIVADQEAFLYAGILFNKETSGIYSRSKTLAFFAKEYVQHDAYCLKLIEDFRPEIVEKYGPDMAGIRHIFK